MIPLLACLVFPALHAATPHTSHEKLVSANGFGVLALDGNDRDHAVLDLFSDHVYQRWDASSDDVWDLLYDAYFGIRSSDGAVPGPWLTSALDLAYEPGTSVLDVTRALEPLEIHEIIFAPAALEWPGFAQLLTITNVSPDTVDETTVFSLQNFHLGTGGTGAEALWQDGGTLFEQGTATGLGMLYRPLPTSTFVGCNEVFDRVRRGDGYDGSCGTPSAPWTGDDRVGGFQWDLGPMGPGETRTVAILHAFEGGWSMRGAHAAIESLLDSADPMDLLLAERAFWDAWHAEGIDPPAELSASELQVFRQALAFLKMAQVREPNEAWGQIPASFPVAGDVDGLTHAWNITWVRDATYAILALVEAGHLSEARDALAFLLQDRAGGYAAWLGVDDYGVSVCRHHGNGDEESDGGEDPNIELDGWGMMPYTLAAFLEAGGDPSLLAETRETVLDRNAQVLRALIEENGLVHADSSIWERHWNGKEKHFTYTQVWAVLGFEATARMLDAEGDASAEGWRDAAETVRAAIQRLLIHPSAGLVGSLEEYMGGDAWKDLAAVEAFNFGVLDAQNRVAQHSIATWDAVLRLPDGPRYIRNDDGDLYDLQEWAFMDLRLAEARRRACDETGARAIEDWITAQAVLNHDTVPELMSAEGADYAGPAPMLGFGSGAYVLAMLHREAARLDCATGPEEHDTGETDADADGDTDADGDGDADGDTDTAREDEDTASKEGPTCGCVVGDSSRPSALALLLPFLAGLLGRRGLRARGAVRP